MKYDEMWSGPLLLLMRWMIKPWKAKDDPDFNNLQ
jgi:hypothetical protein